MAKKYLSLDRLTEYDALLKSQINESDVSTLKSAKEYADEKVSSITSGTVVVKKAEEANHAVSADTAVQADKATKADEATHATSADNATEANHAVNADKATNADNATNATNATKATQDASGNVITTTYETKTDASAKLAEAKGYADTAATTAANKVKDDLLNGAGEAYDTLKELGDLITENKDAIDVLEDVATGKADKEHKHTVEDIEGYTAGVQSDWNQNDETALDFVKNRPFYENSFETILLDEVSEQFTNDGTPTQIFREGYSFVIGQTYTVILDGTTYECVAWDNGSGIGMIGNASMIDFGSDTGEPFVGIYLDKVYNIMCSTAGTHTISISGIVSEIKQLDEKFISYKPGVRTSDGGEIFNDYVNNVANSGSHAEGSMTTASGYEAHAEGYMTTASGLNSHAEGNETTASEWAAHAEGFHTTASGSVSHAEGRCTTASGDSSHAEGNQTIASGDCSHAEGWCTTASSDYQHVQGRYNVDDSAGTYLHIVGNGENINEVIHYSNAHTLDWDGNAWFAGDVYVGSTSGTNRDDGSKKLSTVGQDTEGTVYTINGASVTAGTGAEVFNDYTNNIASGNYSHAEGYSNQSTGVNSHAEGRETKASGESSHAEGGGTKASGNYAHAEGYYTEAGNYSHSEGSNTKALGTYSHAEGSYSETTGSYAHAEGYRTVAAAYAHAEGCESKATNNNAHAEGYYTTASGTSAHTEGNYTTASGSNSHAEGSNTKATSENAHAEGYNTTASNYQSHAEGYYTEASGSNSHAEGSNTKATSENAHAEGYYTTASNYQSHAEGYYSEAKGYTSHAEGYYTIASGQYQHVQGKNNIEDTENKYAHIVGNGAYGDSRSNAHTLDWDGNAWFAGKVYVGGTNQSDASEVALKSDLAGIDMSDYETKDDAQSKLDEAKAYTNTMTSGMATTTVVDNKISTHNTSSTAHSDIRDLITALSTKVNNFLDVSDTTTDQLSEVLTLINNNKGTLDSITSNKVNVSDIVDNLTTANASKVLSANQGVVLKGLIDALQEAVDGKSAEGHKHAISDVTDLQTTLNAKAAQTDLDAVEAKANNANTSITNIVNGTTTVAKATNADSAANAEKLGGQLPSYYAAASAIPTGALANKNIVSESDLDSTLAEKVNAAAEGNHSHSNKTVLDGITATKVSNWDNAEANAKAHTDEKIALLMNNSSEAVDSVMELAEAMSNNADAIKALETVAASKVPTSRKVNGKDLTADITLSSDDVNADAKGSAAGVQSNLDSHTGNTTIHITSDERTKWNAAKTHADSAHAPSDAQVNVIESIKVNGTAQTITSKSVNITVPTQPSDIGAAESTHTHAISEITNLETTLSNAAAGIKANADSIGAHTDRISALETKVGDGFEEITSQEIAALFSA